MFDRVHKMLRRATADPMASCCIWDDCDQEATYCPGHAIEYADFRDGVLNSPEALRLERDGYKTENAFVKTENARLQRHVQALSDDLSNVIGERNRLRAELAESRLDLQGAATEAHTAQKALAEAHAEATMYKTRWEAALEVANRHSPQCSDAAMEGEGDG